MIVTFRKMRWSDDGHGQVGNVYKILFLKKGEKDSMQKTWA
jgi:hypothetical protein